MTLPWKITVVADFGSDHDTPVSATLGDDLLATLGARAKVKGAPGGAREFQFASEADFSPAAVAKALGGDPSAADIDAVLHDPAFQRVESAWRGLQRLLAACGDDVLVDVVSSGRKALGDRFRSMVFEPTLSSAEPTSMVVVDHDFTHKSKDLAILEEIGTMAMQMQAPLVAGAGPGFFDLRYVAHVPTVPDIVDRLHDTGHSGWVEFQGTPPARWIALTINRFLARPPYTGDHDETTDEGRPETFSWARGGWLVGAAVARSVATHGHALDIAGTKGGGFDGLPVRDYPKAANETITLASEAPLDEQTTQHLYRSAFVPLLGALRRDVIVMPMVLTTFRLRPGHPTVEAALSYQLTAGRVATFLSFALGALPDGSAEDRASHLRGELAGFLGGLLGENPDEALSVEAVDDGKAAAIEITPPITLETKPLNLKFTVPLG